MALRLSAFFVRASSTEVAAALRDVVPSAHVHGDDDGSASAFVACVSEPPLNENSRTRELAELSRLLESDVIMLVAVEDSDTLTYRRWHRGSLVRGVSFSRMEVVSLEGTPEPWEVWALHDGRVVDEAALSAPPPPSNVPRAAEVIGAYFGFPGAPALVDLDVVERDRHGADAVPTGNRYCARCRKVVTEPSPQASTVAYARYWRGVCPECERPLLVRPQ